MPKDYDQYDCEEEAKSDEDVGLFRLVMRDLSGKPILVGGALFVIALGVGVLKYSEDWQVLTSLYVIVQIVTTVGYGDVTVNTNATKVFMSIYVLFCLVFLANLMGVITKAIIDRKAQYIRNRMRAMERSMLDHDDVGSHEQAKTDTEKRTTLIVSAILFFGCILYGTLFYAIAERCTCSYGTTNKNYYENCTDEVYVTTNGSKLVGYEACVASGGLLTSWVDAFYMSVITATTIGFGDHSPTSWWGRVFGIPWMIVSVAMTAFFLTAMSDYFDAEEPHFVKASAISARVFEKMDSDRNGWLSRSEYRCYVLLKHGLVSESLMDEIDSHFDELDVSQQGTVTFQAVRARALLESDESE